MSDTTVETQPDNDAPVTTEMTFTGWPQPLTLEATKPRKKKNSAEMSSSWLPKLDPAEIIKFLSTVVPAEKLARALFTEIIRPAAVEATAAGFKVDPASGELQCDDEAYTKAFLEQFEPASRRSSSGPNLKELNEQYVALAQELTQLLVDNEKNPGDSTIKARMHRVMVEMQEIQVKKDAKTRAPKGTRKAKAPAA